MTLQRYHPLGESSITTKYSRSVLSERPLHVNQSYDTRSSLHPSLHFSPGHGVALGFEDVSQHLVQVYAFDHGPGEDGQKAVVDGHADHSAGGRLEVHQPAIHHRQQQRQAHRVRGA